MKSQKKGKKKDKVHQIKGNLEATMAKKNMESDSDIQATVEDVNVTDDLEATMTKKVPESGSDIQATVEDVNVTDAGKHGHAKVVDKK